MKDNKRRNVFAFFDKKNNSVKRQDSDDGFASDDFILDKTDSDSAYSSGTFINSVEQLTADDIKLNPSAEKKKTLPVYEIIRRVAFVFFLGMFIVSSVMLIDNLIDKQKGEEIYAQLEAEFFSDGFTVNAADAFKPEDGEISYLPEDSEQKKLVSMTDTLNSLESGESTADTKEYNETLEKIRASLQSLAKINPDLYGWISVEGTNINYPLVQGDDNQYYLDHAYTGDYLPLGSIFVDYRCNTSITKNYNTVIYGHNLTNGNMFHDVTKFFKDEYFNGVYIVIYTMDGIYYYEPFSVYETRNDYQYFRTGFTSGEDFIEFAEEMRDNSQMEKDVSFTKNDRIITLSTCTNGAYYARYALHAKLVKTVLD